MLTRCPRCDTTFRVTPEQLKARQGRVRCGSCQAVFNALETLVDELAIGAPSASGSPEYAVAPEAQSAPIEAAPPTNPTPEDLMPSPAVDLVPDAPVMPEVLLEPWPLPEAIDTEPAVGAAEEPIAAEVAEPHLEALPDSSDGDIREPNADDRPEPGIEADGQAAAGEALPLPLPEPLPAPEPESESATEPWPGPEPLLHDDEQPRRRWPWVVGGVLALAALGLQVVMHNRVELAVLAPETKPALLAACELLGCELSLPRKIEQIGIEASDLHPDPSAEHRLDLTATLRNRAPFPQVWPALELTLTDTDDKALVRRVLAPEEYLPAKISPVAGFPAGGEQAISLAIDAKDVPAVGYRLYVFYP